MRQIPKKKSWIKRGNRDESTSKFHSSVSNLMKDDFNWRESEIDIEKVDLSSWQSSTNYQSNFFSPNKSSKFSCSNSFNKYTTQQQLFVSGLPRYVEAKQLSSLFSQFLPLDVDIPQPPRGFAFVVLPSEITVDLVISKFHPEIQGFKLTLSKRKENYQKPNNQYSQSNGFQSNNYNHNQSNNYNQPNNGFNAFQKKQWISIKQ